MRYELLDANNNVIANNVEPSVAKMIIDNYFENGMSLTFKEYIKPTTVMVSEESKKQVTKIIKDVVKDEIKSNDFMNPPTKEIEDIMSLFE